MRITPIVLSALPITLNFLSDIHEPWSAKFIIETFVTAFVNARVEKVLPTFTKSKTLARHFNTDLPAPTLTEDPFLTIPLNDIEDPIEKQSKPDSLLKSPEERILSALFKL